MKKKILCLVMGLTLMTSFVGCTSADEKEEGAAASAAAFADKEWLFYDEVAAEHHCLSFGSDGSYSYHCQCGEPIGDSDLYEKYEYDEAAGVIKLSNDYDGETDEIRVLGFNEYHLMLEIDGEIRDFGLYEQDTFSNFFSEQAESYLSGYESRCTVVDLADGKMTYGPVNYDPEGPYAEGPFEEYEVADDLVIFDMVVQSFRTIEDESEYEESYDVSFTEIGKTDLEYILDAGAGLAFIWFNDDMQVEKIVFFGENAVTE